MSNFEPSNELREVLPVTISPSEIGPYSEEKSRLIAGTRRMEVVEVDYRPTEFERPPSPFETRLAFKLFHREFTGVDGGSRNEEDFNEFRIYVPADRRRLVFGLDTVKSYMHFTYVKDDDESRQAAQGFIDLLKSN